MPFYIFQRENGSSSKFPVAMKTTSSCLRSGIECERVFYYAPCPFIDRAPQKDATSLTMYTAHKYVIVTQE